MANILTQNPMVIDTAGATSQVSEVVITKIIMMPSSNTNNFVMTNKLGSRTIFDLKSSSQDPIVLDFAPPLALGDGMAIKTLTNGTMYIFV